MSTRTFATNNSALSTLEKQEPRQPLRINEIKNKEDIKEPAEITCISAVTSKPVNYMKLCSLQQFRKMVHAERQNE
jgi:hypothetical protein